MIVIIDYKMGNLGSIKNMMSHLGHDSLITSDLDEIRSATKLILPGVGKFDHGMTQLNSLEITEVLTEKMNSGTPIAGICLGMQLLAKSSEEGTLPGLGFVDAKVRKFKFPKEDKRRVPHMGWNTVTFKRSNIVTKGFDEYEETRFYFVHSYYMDCENQEDILLETNYGHNFCSAVSKKNVWGFQFHPEKSHKYGMKLLKNFAEL